MTDPITTAEQAHQDMDADERTDTVFGWGFVAISLALGAAVAWQAGIL